MDLMMYACGIFWNASRSFSGKMWRRHWKRRRSLEDCMAVVCDSLQEVRDYLDESGADIVGMSLAEIGEASEVFSLPDGRYLVVEV